MLDRNKQSNLILYLIHDEYEDDRNMIIHLSSFIIAVVIASMIDYSMGDFIVLGIVSIILINAIITISAFALLKAIKFISRM